jgi:hypothetical protein
MRLVMGSTFRGQAQGNLNPKWIWSDGAEVMIVTNMGQFQESIEQISLGSDNRLKVKMIDLLCLGKTSDENHAKLRISHPRNEELGKYFPLVILDGKDGFGARHHLSNQSNVMIILNRSEYQEDINNSVLQLQAISEEAPRMHKKNIDMIFPAGFECAAYIVKVA